MLYKEVPNDVLNEAVSIRIRVRVDCGRLVYVTPLIQSSRVNLPILHPPAGIYVSVETVEGLGMGGGGLSRNMFGSGLLTLPAFGRELGVHQRAIRFTGHGLQVSPSAFRPGRRSLLHSLVDH